MTTRTLLTIETAADIARSCRDLRDGCRYQREARIAELESASAEVRRKERAAVKAAGVGKELVERIEAAAKKRVRPRKRKGKK
jgi:hypothetical protein